MNDSLQVYMASVSDLYMVTSNKSLIYGAQQKILQQYTRKEATKRRGLVPGRV